MRDQSARRGDSEVAVEAAGCWLLAAGCWLLASGCWLLAAGCWLLASGFWLLASGQSGSMLFELPSRRSGVLRRTSDVPSQQPVASS
jgi:hypothetical protein